MAKLFKDKAIKKDLEKFEIPNFEKKIDIIKKWLEAYKNKTLHQKTESQCEQTFNQSFFVELLGYTTFPNPIYTIEPKATTETSGQKPDAALGYFVAEQNRTIAVVEIKDVNTALDRSQKREGNLSPVQQAFKYKPQYKDCTFVIATNFYEIRLHKDDQLDYELFTLESLADPKNDHFELRKFYYLLCAENFINKSGKTKTEELLSDIRANQEIITKNFYKQYKFLRQELIKDIVKNNSVPKSELLLIIEKAQKIIDRIVFVCFCEDKDLLPEDTLLKVIKHAENSFSNHWDILKGFFNAIDRGSEKLEIPHGYNGGLFAEDQKLNNLKISDEVCKKFLEFGKFDFSEDLSVNILGHIFEQSISDIEEIKSKTIEGEEVDKKKSKRKKDGIFYTPDYIVDYIVKNALGKYLEEKEVEIKQKNNLKEDINDVNYKKRALAVYLEYQVTLRNVKVLDPACGSGAFLVKVFDYLLAENIRVANIIADLNNDQTDFMNSEGYIKSLLESNIYGVDLNPESVEITKLSLWLKSAQKDKKLVNLKNNIKCGNSLIDDPEVGGNRAFKWGDEFNKIMNEGGFDVIVGNPPYVRQELLKGISDYLEKNYKSYAGKADLFVYFFEKAINLLKKGGYISFICSGKFFEANYGKSLLNFLIENVLINEIIDFGDLEVFPGVTAYPIIFNAKRGVADEKLNFYYSKISDLDFNDLNEKKSEQKIKINQTSFKKNDFKFLDEKINKLVNKLTVGRPTLKDYCGLPLVGIKTGFNEGFLIQKNLKTPLAKGYIFGGDIKKYMPAIAENNVIFPYLWQGSQYQLVQIENYPEDEKILSINKEKLEKRAIIKDGLTSGVKKWFEYQQINTKIDFNNEYIVYPNVSLGNNFTMSRNAIVDMTAFIIKSNDRYLLAILNSSITKYLMNILAISRRGGYLEYKVQYIEKIPIPNIQNDKKLLFEKKVILILVLNEQFQEKHYKFLKLIQIEFQIEKITKKIEKFYELDFDGLVVELELKKLSLDKKEALLNFFEKYKRELLELKTKIDTTDKEIDEMVFDLYGLSGEEKRVIMEN